MTARTAQRAGSFIIGAAGDELAHNPGWPTAVALRPHRLLAALHKPRPAGGAASLQLTPDSCGQ
eukprot:13115317-Alexandrium_andersonii.AAC.1